MSRIIFFRHGKSDWDADYTSDHERPLKGRGRKAARRMGEFVRSADSIPDLVISSTAVRAQSTAVLAMESGEWDCDLVLNGALYGASVATIMGVIRRLSSDVSTVVLVGHEPTWSSCVLHLTGADARVPTAAMACIDLYTAEWSAVGEGTGELQWLVTPRIL